MRADGMTTLRKMRRNITAAWTYYADLPRWMGLRRLPKVLSLPITDNCNARCVMCDVWRNKSTDELTSAELRRILSGRLFERIEHVGVSGGEPSLRKDLVDICQVVVDTLPSLKTLSITTHGFHTARWEASLPRIRDACAARRVSVSLNVSVDGLESTHDAVRGVPGVYEKAMKTTRLARDMGIAVQWQCTISTTNLYGAEALARAASAANQEVIFRLATPISRLNNADSMGVVALDEDAASFFGDFVGSPLAATVAHSPSRRLFYADLAKRLIFGGVRRAPCVFQNEGLVLGPHGEMHHCSISTRSFGDARVADPYEAYFSAGAESIRQDLLRRVCPGCVHDQTGRWSPVRMLLEKYGRGRLAKTATRAVVATRYVRTVTASIAGSRLRRVWPQKAKPAPTRFVGEATAGTMLVGCYGGEHVGDAAILGGVIKRLAAAGQSQRFVVMSSRPKRTLRWVHSLRLDASIDVEFYDDATVRRVIDQQGIGSIVIAGGPLMDLPGLTDMHLRAMSLARRRGLPVHAVGVGVGPCNNFMSRAAVRQILRLCQTVQVRSMADAARAAAWKVSVTVDRDPAFDYLADRMALTPAESQVSVEPRARKTIAINLRPLWRKYVRRAGVDAATERVVAAFTGLIDSRGADVDFVFLPFNADQFGFSDLSVAYRIQAALRDPSRLKIVEKELGIDEALSMLRQCDGVIAMRFHACIFSMAAGLPIVGVDYSDKPNGKVRTLLQEAGAAAQVLSVTDISEKKLIDASDLLIRSDTRRDV